MREILFRGKTESGKWKYGNLITGDWYSDGKAYILSMGQQCQVIEETVGQYTGLTDKNGRKIFEGDIFEFDDEIWDSYYTSCGTEYNSYEVKNCGVVGFDDEQGCYDFVKYKFTNNSVEADLHENHNINFFEFVSELEKIGNIHDNPELLKESEQE